MKKYNQLCVWEATMLGDSSVDDFVKFMADTFGVRARFAEEVVTNPDLDEFGDPVPETGGRHDLLFWVHNDDIAKFAIPRFRYRIRWWEDVVSYNDRAYLYSQEVLDKYPVCW